MYLWINLSDLLFVGIIVKTFLNVYVSMFYTIIDKPIHGTPNFNCRQFKPFIGLGHFPQFLTKENYLFYDQQEKKVSYKLIIKDLAERYDFWPRLWLFLFPFLFPPKKKREEVKENELTKIVIKGHAFLLDQSKYSVRWSIDYNLISMFP